MSIFYFPIFPAYGLNMKPNHGAKLYFFEVGTTTPKATFPTDAETPGTEQDHPIEADITGRFPTIYISGLYKIVVTDRNGDDSQTFDNLQGRDGDVQLKGNFDSTTNSSNYPSTGSEGDKYIVTTGFTMAAASGGHTLLKRDFIIANKNGATGIDADWDIERGSRSFDASVDFETSKDLVINYASNTTSTLVCSIMKLINSLGQGEMLFDVDDTFNMATDRNEGTGVTNVLASTWYQKWKDTLGVIKLVPDLESVADAQVTNSLSNTVGGFQTYLVQPDDEIYQTTDLTKGYVKAVTTDGLLTIKDADGADLDLFPVGNENYKIRMLSPPGLGEFRGRIGAVFSNSGKNLDNSTYTQPQDEKDYNGDGTDFSVSSNPAVTSLKRAKAFIRQSNDWTGKGIWKIEAHITYAVASGARTTAVCTLTGVLNKNVASYLQAISASSQASTAGIFQAVAVNNTNTYEITHGSVTTTSYTFVINVELDKKPTFHN